MWKIATRVITAGVNPSFHIAYRHCHIEQYFKDERALRTETTFNDFGIGRRLSNLSYLRTLGDHINRRVLETESLARDCGPAPAGPITYAVGGKQYVSVPAGNAAFTFSLRQ
jgi:hypothetical protein